MSPESDPEPGKTKTAAWRRIVLEYQSPSRWRATWQLVNTIGPYVALWYLMYLSLPISVWLVLPLATLAGLFVIRIFIIFHDCGHRSYFKSAWANDVVG